MTEVRRALVFEGGGARGAFQAGVLAYLSEHPFRFPVDMVCGSSIGAVHAAAFAFGKVPELNALWSRLRPHQVYRRRSWRALAWDLVWRRRLTHLLDGRPLRRLLKRIFGDLLLADSPIPIVISALNLQTGTNVLFDRNSPILVVDALMASMAIQGLFPAHLDRGFQLLDGGNGINLPLAPALAMGARELLVVRANRPEEFVPEPYRDVLSIFKRVFSIMVSRAANVELTRARELSTFLEVARQQRAQLRQRLSLLPSDKERTEILEFLDQLPSLVEGKTELCLRVLEPPSGTMLPDILELNPAVSRRLLRLGHQAASQHFEQTP